MSQRIKLMLNQELLTWYSVYINKIHLIMQVNYNKTFEKIKYKGCQAFSIKDRFLGFSGCMQLPNSAIVAQGSHQQYISKRAWLCSHKTYSQQQNIWLIERALWETLC